MLEGIAEVGALDAVPRHRSAERRLVPFLVLFPKQLFDLDGRTGHVSDITGALVGPLASCAATRTAEIAATQSANHTNEFE